MFKTKNLIILFFAFFVILSANIQAEEISNQNRCSIIIINIDQIHNFLLEKYNAKAVKCLDDFFTYQQKYQEELNKQIEEQKRTQSPQGICNPDLQKKLLLLQQVDLDTRNFIAKKAALFFRGKGELLLDRTRMSFLIADYCKNINEERTKNFINSFTSEDISQFQRITNPLRELCIDDIKKDLLDKKQ